MPKTKKFADLTRELRKDPARAARIDAYRRTMEAMLTVTQAREAHVGASDKLSSAIDAWEELNIDREHEDDVSLTTLRSYVEALGGELGVTARFPDGQIIKIA